MKKSLTLASVLLFLLSSLGANFIWGQHYTGTFQLEAGDVTITLTIHQDGNNVLSGTMNSNNGSAFSIQGTVAEGVAAGAISSSEAALFFEAFLDGNDLTFSIIEPDQYNMPDYNTAQYLAFTKSNLQPSNQQVATNQPAKSTSSVAGSSTSKLTQVHATTTNALNLSDPEKIMP